NRGPDRSRSLHQRPRWRRADMPLCHAFQRNAEALGRVFIPLDHPAYARAGSTDMGNVSHYVPSIHPNLAAAPADCVIHNPEFAKWAGSEMGDQAAIHGAKALAMTAIDFFTDANLRTEVKAAFASTRAWARGQALLFN